MSRDQKNIDNILVIGLAHILKRTIKLKTRDQLAIAQEYKEWINCVSTNDFSAQEILVIDNFKFK